MRTAVPRAVQAATFTGHQQTAIGKSEHAVQVQPVRVFETIERLPRHTAVVGLQDHAVGTHYPAFTGIAKPYPQ
ncbi:hypothetical protein D3C80_1992520 [compost metagenome]